MTQNRIWSPIRTILNVKPSNKYQLSSLVIESKTGLNLEITYNQFNNLFTQIASKIDKKKLEKRDKKRQDYLQESNEKSFFLSPTCQNDVEDIIQNKQTNKECRSNSIAASIIKTFKK